MSPKPVDRNLNDANFDKYSLYSQARTNGLPQAACK